MTIAPSGTSFVPPRQLISLACSLHSLLNSSETPKKITHGEMRGTEDSRCISPPFKLSMSFLANDISRQRWNILFHSRDTPSDLREALKSEQDDNICDDGLRSICWKVWLREYALETLC